MSKFGSFENVMAFIGEKLPPVIAQPPAYPFIGEKTVRKALTEDYDLQEAVVCMLYFLQTESEQARRDTESKNKCGFMSSDAFNGTRIAETLIQDGVLSVEDCDRVPKIAMKYARQTTVQLRRMAMVNDPKLASYAAVFSVK